MMPSPASARPAAMAAARPGQVRDPADAERVARRDQQPLVPVHQRGDRAAADQAEEVHPDQPEDDERGARVAGEPGHRDRGLAGNRGARERGQRAERVGPGRAEPVQQPGAEARPAEVAAEHLVGER